MTIKLPLTALFAGLLCRAGAVPADCAWAVQEIISPVPLLSLEAAELFADSPGEARVLRYQSATINRNDPEAPGAGGFFPGDLPFAANNLTTAAATAGNDDDFVIIASCEIVITEESDYTFGFSSDEGARLRIAGAVFSGSTRLNPANPANPAHAGDTLRFPGTTANSDTLGVCHLTPGIYEVEFLTWERTGGAYAEVFAAAGAKTSMDDSFRLIGGRPSGNTGDDSRILSPGWKVTMRRDQPQHLEEALTKLYESWGTGVSAAGLRLTTTADAPERDPVTFLLEGTRGRPEEGPWIPLAGGNTGAPAARLTQGSVVSFPPTDRYSSFRLTFPSVRNPAAADSMQIAEVDLLDAGGADLTAPGIAVIATSANSPSGQSAAAATDNTPSSRYRNFDRDGSGFILTPHAFTRAVINFTDPHAGGGGHGTAQTPFPGDGPGDDNAFAMGALATIRIATRGDYTFCIHSDGGARLRMPGTKGWKVIAPGPAATLSRGLPDGMQTDGGGDVLGIVFLEEGTYEVELVYHEKTDGAYIGVWSAFGRHTAFSTASFGLLGANNRSFGPDTVPFALRAPSEERPPVNDDFQQALSIPGWSARVAGSNTGATLEDGEPRREDRWLNTVWWKWTAPSAGTIQINTAGSEFDTSLSFYGGPATLGGLTLLASNDDDRPLRTSKLEYAVAAGGTYYIQVGGFDGENGFIQLQLSPPAAVVRPANDAFASAQNLGSAPSLSESGSTAEATGETLEPDHWPFNPANPRSSVWFKWTAPWSGGYIIHTEGSLFDTVLAVYTGDHVSRLTLVTADDQGPGPTDQSRLEMDAAAGVTYYIALDGYGASSRGPYVLTLLPVPNTLHPEVITGPGLNAFRLRWHSEPFVSYRLEQSAGLSDWSPVTRCFSLGAETFFDIPGISASTPLRFYRIWRE